jgi:hypothetical protein
MAHISHTNQSDLTQQTSFQSIGVRYVGRVIGVRYVGRVFVVARQILVIAKFIVSMNVRPNDEVIERANYNSNVIPK